MEWEVGGVRIVKVLERESLIPLDRMLADLPSGAVDRYPWLRPDFVSAGGDARLSIHGLVIDTGARRILVDTCIGEHELAGMASAPSSFLDGLAAAGYRPEDVDTVVCTHLHFDHVGWNTRLVDGEWAVTFPQARYLFGRVEWEHWSTTEGGYVNVAETVAPVLASGQADLVEVDHQICAEVRLGPTPGHTPGHVSVIVESGRERAVITGDLAHHPIQFAMPGLSSVSDSDRAQAVLTRRAFLADRSADGALVIGTHFGGRTAGRVAPDGEGYVLMP